MLIIAVISAMMTSCSPIVSQIGKCYCQLKRNRNPRFNPLHRMDEGNSCPSLSAIRSCQRDIETKVSYDRQFEIVKLTKEAKEMLSVDVNTGLKSADINSMRKQLSTLATACPKEAISKKHCTTAIRDFAGYLLMAYVLTIGCLDAAFLAPAATVMLFVTLVLKVLIHKDNEDLKLLRERYLIVISAIYILLGGFTVEFLATKLFESDRN